MAELRRGRALCIVVFSLTVFLPSFALRFYHLDHRSIWMDEDAQASKALVGLNFKLIDKAASQQQPPLDYALESIGLTIFGWTEIGARIHAAVMGAFAAVLFAFLLIEVVRNPLATAFGIILFAAHPLLVRYAQEGRPISTGVFFAVLWLWMILRLIEKKTSMVSGAFFVHGIVLFSVCLCFLLSVGFQPIVFVITTLAASIPLWARSTHRPKLLLLYISSAAAFLAALPILLRTINKGLPYMGSSSLAGQADLLLRSFASFKPNLWIQYWTSLCGCFGFPILLIALFSIIGLLLSRSNALLQNRRPFYYLAFTAVLYPIVFHGMFHGLIKNHSVALRYYLSFTPVLIALLSILLSNALSALHPVFKRRKHIGIIGAVLLVLFSGGSIFNTVASLMDEYQTNNPNDWRSLYALFQKERGKVPGAAYLMNLTRRDKWGPVRFYAARFYYPNTEKQPVRLKNIDELPDDLRSGKFERRSSVYLTVPYGYELISASMFEKMKNVDFHRFTALSVVRLHISSKNPAMDIRRLFEGIAAEIPRKEESYKIFETLAWIRIYDQDVEGAGQVLQILKKLDKRGKLREKVLPKLNKALRALKRTEDPEDSVDLQ